MVAAAAFFGFVAVASIMPYAIAVFGIATVTALVAMARIMVGATVAAVGIVASTALALIACAGRRFSLGCIVAGACKGICAKKH